MAHSIAKLLLDHCDSLAARSEVIGTVLQLGMSLREVEQYLDWRDQLPNGPSTPVSLPGELFCESQFYQQQGPKRTG